MRTRLVWLATVVLVAFGIIAAAGRTVWISNFATHTMPLRNASFHTLGLTDPRLDARTREVREFDIPYGSHPLATLLHVIPGGLFIGAALLQFSAISVAADDVALGPESTERGEHDEQRTCGTCDERCYGEVTCNC